MNLHIKKEITTVVEVKTSPIASVAVAFRVDELILFPINLLNFESQNLNPIEMRSKIKGSNSKLTGVGLIIF